METGASKTGGARGRPRDPERERRVLVAAIEEYAERGWAGLTMDGVARRAGVGKSTVYLRWTNKEDLLAAAVQTLGQNFVPVDTGSVRGDLTTLAANLQQNYGTKIGWGLIRILIDAAGSGQGVDELHEVNELYRRAAYAIIERGVERGELRAGAPSQLVINVMYGTFVIYRMMAPWDEREGMLPDPDALVEQVVDFVMEGLSPWVIRGADA